MAAEFDYKGTRYRIDDQGTIVQQSGASWIPVASAAAADVGLQQAAAAADQGAAAPAAPAAAAPAAPTPPAAAPGVSSDYSVHQTGTTSTVPPATPADTSKGPPRVSAALREEQASVQKQLDAANKRVAANGGDPTPADASLISSLNARLATITQNITVADQKDATSGPGSIIGTPSPTDKYILRRNPDGTDTVITEENPIWDKKTEKPQIATIGNHVVAVGNDGTVTVAYDDRDAQALAQRQTAVGEKNAATSAAAQATNDFAARAKADLDARVSRGEDAASIRAEQAQQLTELHDAWVRADGDRRAAQQELDSYNAERHATARDTHDQQQLTQTAELQKMQDATTRYGYDKNAETSRYATDKSAESSRYATDVGAANARLQAGGAYLSNALQTLASINDKLPPGSALAGEALEGMLKYGQRFLEGMQGLPAKPGEPAPGASGATSAPGAGPPIDPTAPIATQVGVNPQGTAQYQDYGQVLKDMAASQMPNSSFPAVGVQAQSQSPNPEPDMGAFFSNALAGAAPAPAAVPDNGDQAAAMMAAQNAAQHQANMAADGTPYARPGDVARIFGRGGNA